MFLGATLRGSSLDTEYPVGVRSLGMGGVGVSTSERPSVVSQNLGSVVRLEAYAAELFTASLFGLVRANYLGGVFPFSERRAVGFDWLRLDFEDEELTYAENRFRLGYSFLVRGGLSVGVGVNYRTVHANLDDAELGSGAGWSTDGGFLWRLPFSSRVTMGVSVRNWYSATSRGRWLPGAWMRIEEGKSQRASPRVVTWGVQYRSGKLLLAAEQGNEWRFGVEVQPARPFAVRSGISFPRAHEAPTWSFGASASWKALAIDYAFVVPPTLSPTSYVGMTVEWSYRIPPVVIEGISLAPLYSALREFYSRSENAARETPYSSPSDVRRTTHERLGEVWLYNPHRESVQVSVRLQMERFTSRRGTEAVESVLIPPGERRVVPLRKMLLSDACLELTEDRPVEVRVEVRDVRNEARRRAVKSANTLLYGRNEIRLDDVAKLAVFVTPTNLTVRRFAETAIQEAERAPWEFSAPPNVKRALSLFAALQDLAYGHDPNLPRESGTLDAVHYPAELLTRLRALQFEERPVGDCDDSTVLVCALFESVGIPTALVQTPGHVFMAFDPGGISLEEAQRRTWDEYILPIDGNAWIPLETTALGKGFAAAWREGLEQTRFGVLNSITTRLAWERYGNANPRLSPERVTVSREVLLARMAETVSDEWFVKAMRPWHQENAK